MRLISELNRSRRQTVIVITHDPTVAAYAGRAVHMRDGRLFDKQVENEVAHEAV